MDHLEAFLQSFVTKRSKERWLLALAKVKKNENLLRGMDALYRDLDEQFCIPVPNGSQQQEIDFVRQALRKYKLTNCYVLSADDSFHQQTLPIEEALQRILGTNSTSILSFIPGRVALFEGHSTGDRYLCVREV
ncbi:hypothetical protein [Hymenobacter swuensis]|uniref:hypothetical protein n=1 Tax=Hymenobacter swuensis TaxID=1446467 RepID=UPI0005C4838B|nr:hypothetical protein [Hymenobacter swuensis]